MGRVCVRSGVIRRLLALKTLVVGVWEFERVVWFVDLGHFARHGDQGAVFCNCCMGRFGLLEVGGGEGLPFRRRSG